MKALAKKFLLFICIFFTFSFLTDASADLKLGDSVDLPIDGGLAKGFVQYKGEHHGVTFCVLSADIGSAIPSEDFRLYVGTGHSYRLLLSLPMMNGKGFRCACDEDILKVYLTRNYDDHTPLNGKNLVFTINLLQVAQAYEPNIVMDSTVTQVLSKYTGSGEQSWLANYYGKTLSSLGEIVSIQIDRSRSVTPSTSVVKWIHPDLWEIIEHSEVQDYHSSSVAIGIPPFFTIKYSSGLCVRADRYIATITLPDGRAGSALLLPRSTARQTPK